MFEFIFEILGEFLLQMVIELLIEMGFHSLAEPFRKSPNPWFAAIGYILLGSIFGYLSLFIFPSYLIHGKMRLFNLIATPIAVGLSMALIGKWRIRRGQNLLRIDRFIYGYLFALFFALIRFWFAS